MIRIIPLLSLLVFASLVAQEPPPRTPQEYQRSGVQHFKRGEFKQAIADWDKVIELAPSQEPYHWQRGIAYYYAGEFKKGRKQFELHQTVNPDDVENAAWHFLCVARDEGVEAARKALLPVGPDGRVPMKEIYNLFKGAGSAADVLAAAEAGSPPKQALEDRLCYAYLYLGLYAEAEGDKKLALEHMRKAAVDYAQPHYMGEVARVHLKQIELLKD